MTTSRQQNLGCIIDDLKNIQDDLDSIDLDYFDSWTKEKEKVKKRLKKKIPKPSKLSMKQDVEQKENFF